MKVCSTCHSEKDLASFNNHQRAKDKLNSECKACVKTRNKISYDKNRLIGGAEFYRNKRNSRIKHNYGITLVEYDNMLATQSGRCAICRCEQDPVMENFSIDHDHNTGKVRGLLCSHCNHALGHAKDSLEIVKNMALYLEAYSELSES